MTFGRNRRSTLSRKFSGEGPPLPFYFWGGPLGSSIAYSLFRQLGAASAASRLRVAMLKPGQIIGESGLPEWTPEGLRAHLQAQAVWNALPTIDLAAKIDPDATLATPPFLQYSRCATCLCRRAPITIMRASPCAPTHSAPVVSPPREIPKADRLCAGAPATARLRRLRCGDIAAGGAGAGGPQHK